MLYLLRSLVFLPMACAVLAAPAPKDSWENSVDPDKDCKIEVKDGAVTIELPGGDHEFDPKRKRFNAPRILREVEGDFVAEVRVSGSFRPSAKSSRDGKEPPIAAGLLMILTNQDYMRLDYAVSRLLQDRQPDKGKGPQKEAGQRKGDLYKRPSFQWQGSQVMESNLSPPWKPDPNAKEEHIYLRFERQGNDLCEAISLDGKTWTTHFSANGLQNLPKKLKVDLAAYSSSTEPFKVRFDQFKLIRGEEKKQ